MYSLLKNIVSCFLFLYWKIGGIVNFLVGGGGGEMLFRFVYVPIKRYSLFSFCFIKNFKRWQGGWFWSYFFRVTFFLAEGRSWVQGPESRVQWTVQSRFRICPKDDMTSRQGDTTNQQDNRTSRQDNTTNWQDNRTSRQDDTTNRQGDRTSWQDDTTNR